MDTRDDEWDSGLGAPMPPSRAPKHRELGTDGKGRFDREVMPQWWRDAGGTAGLVWSFQDAARALTDRQLEAPVRNDGSFPPIAFLWRHTIELALKRGIVFLVGRAADPLTEVEADALKEHDLLPLWDGWRARQQELAPAWSPKDVKHAQRLVRQLNGLAPDPSTFRYIANQKGKTFELPDRVDLAEWGDAMELVVGVVMYLEDHFYALEEMG